MCLSSEAAYLFSYRVWQTVADDLSGGTYTGSELTCGSYHLFQLRAKVAGSVYGEGASVLVSARSCTRSKSDGARAVRDPSDPPKLRLVMDNPETDSIQLRLWDGDNPVSGMQKFDAERTLPRTSPPTSWPSSAVSIGQKPTRAEFRWRGLACSSSYYFRAQGQGNGVQYSTAWSPWSDVVHGATWACTPPTPPQVVNVVTDRPTRDSILVRWDYPPYDIGFAKFKVRYRPANDPNGWVGAGSEITDGSKRVEGLTCGSSYYFQVSGKGNNNKYADSYGPWSDEVHGSTSGCLSPPPAPYNFTASFIPPLETGGYSLELIWDALSGTASYQVERSDDDGNTWPQRNDPGYDGHVTSGITGTQLTVSGLVCVNDYKFRVSAYGDGSTYQAVYGPAREVERYVPIDQRNTGTLDPCTKPIVSVIPLPERKATLRWNEIFGYTYTVEVRRFDKANIFDDTNFEQTYTGSVWSHEINLDDVFAGSGDALLDNQGLADHAQGYEFRVTASDGTVSNSSTVIIIDTPILKAIGNSTGSGITHGEVTLEWTSVRDVLDDPAYDNTKGKYTFRVRRLSDSITGPDHTSLNWKPDTMVVDEDPDATVTTIGGKKKLLGLKPEEIHGIQLIYTVNVMKGSVTKEVKVFAARDAYVWPSNRRAGYLGHGGERVATFPLNYPLDADKAYVYRICDETFADPTATPGQNIAIKRNWVRFIEHALGQWQEWTEDLVTLRHDTSLSCTDYTMLATAIKDYIINNYGMTQLTSGQSGAVTNYVKGLADYTAIVPDDILINEIKMIDIGAVPYDALQYAKISEGLAQVLGFSSCVFDRPGCAVRKTKETRGVSEVISTTDIFLSRDVVGNRSPNIPGGDTTVDRSDAPFNSCGARRSVAYETLVHEAGHALGIRGKVPPRFTIAAPASDPDVQIYFHPTVADSVMSYETALMLPDDPDCSPHPLDIMVIYALYQTLP